MPHNRGKYKMNIKNQTGLRIRGIIDNRDRS